jgi:predicted ABC-type ATPase
MPKAVVIAGPNGAGKSTTAPLLLREALAVKEFVNADTIAAGLSAFAPQTVAFAAGRVMLGRVRELAAMKSDFAFETTLASRSFAPWLRELQQQGYELHLIYLWLPDADLAVERIAERVRRGGHSVPEADVRRRYLNSLSNFFNLYRPIADSWLMLDNSLQSEPQPIAWRNTGGPVHIVNNGPWIVLRERYEKDILNKR